MNIVYAFLMLILTLAGNAAIAGESRMESSARHTPEAMEQMQERMQAMHEQMQRIHETKDPEERQRLMHEHMKSMHEGMTMMGRMRGDTAPTGGMGSAGMARHEYSQQCKDDDAGCLRMQAMQRRQEQMRERMDMMGMMMEQMMEHQMSREADE